MDGIHVESTLMAEALSNLSDFFSFLQDATGVVGDKAEFAVHGLTRDDDGKLTYSRVKFTDSESLDLTTNEGLSSVVWKILLMAQIHMVNIIINI